jgi:hypothetical protein
MDANSKSNVQKKTFIEKQLSSLNVEKIARETGFYRAAPRKTSITNLIVSFLLMVLTGENGYHSWALHLKGLTGIMVSRVALWKRMGKELAACLQAILEQIFHTRVSAPYLTGKNKEALFSHFGEIYIQDSTIISLPEALKDHYKGSVSGGRQKSSMRLQVIYALFSGTFRKFDMNSFTDNDQGASGQIIKLLKAGDLVIRDLGYFVLKVFRQIASAGAFFLNPYRYGTYIYDARTGQQIQLRELLKDSTVDREVLIGAKEKLRVRIVAVKLPDHVAAERRRKAKSDRDKRLNHSKEYMESLDWAIFITNVSPQVWGPMEILKAYRIRWHIEIIFKGWKSHLKMAGLVPEAPRANRSQEKYLWLYKYRLDSAILMMLIFILIFQVNIYTSLCFKIWQKSGKLVSTLKLYAYIARLKEKILQCCALEDLEPDIAYYATYEKRRKRLNHLERLIQLFDYQPQYERS